MEKLVNGDCSDITYWAHSMGPYQSPLSCVVVVVVVDIARRLHYSYSWRAKNALCLKTVRLITTSA